MKRQPCRTLNSALEPGTGVGGCVSDREGAEQLGRVLRASGDLEAAEDLYEQSLPFRKHNPYAAAICLTNLVLGFNRAGRTASRQRAPTGDD